MSTPIICPHARFATSIISGPETGYCWLWTGRLNHEGYGVFNAFFPHPEAEERIKFQSAHRWAYHAYVGPIPEGYQIDHLCRVRRCANPYHLEAVTGRENLLRGNTFQAKNAAKTHCDHGHPFDEKNTGYTSEGRRCRACAADRTRQSRGENGNVQWEKTKSDPVKLEEHRSYRREWAQRKRDRIKAEEPALWEEMKRVAAARARERTRRRSV